MIEWYWVPIAIVLTVLLNRLVLLWFYRHAKVEDRKPNSTFTGPTGYRPGGVGYTVGPIQQSSRKGKWWKWIR